MLSIIAGHDPRDPTSETAPVPDYLEGIETGVTGTRVAVSKDYFYDHVDAEIERHLDASLETLRAAGADIVSVQMPQSLDQVLEMHRIVFQFEAAQHHRTWMSNRPDDYTAWTRLRLSPGLDISTERYAAALEQRERLRSEFLAAVFDSADMLHAPVVPIPVPTIADSDPDTCPDYLELSAHVSHCTRPINAFHLPALSLPAGLDHNGVPVGFQLIGRPDEEASLFRTGRAFELESGWDALSPPL
jgi:aspartyl-tRNA(Asn)/glutamyl-tRNA(Gln) amidotransferase subunit A